MTTIKQNRNLPFDPLMRQMSQGYTWPPQGETTLREPARKETVTLKLQEEWRLFNISRQAKGLKPLSLEEYLKQQN